MNNLKLKILTHYLIPLFTNQWTKMYENLFLIHKIKKKLREYLSLYHHLDDLEMYLYMIDLLELVAEKQKRMDQQERNFSDSDSKETMASMVVKLSAIKLLPEYEIYNSIFGRPKRENKEKYDLEKIHTIQELLKNFDVDYDKIKKVLEKKYPK